MVISLDLTQLSLHIKPCGCRRTSQQDGIQVPAGRDCQVVPGKRGPLRFRMTLECRRALTGMPPFVVASDDYALMMMTMTQQLVQRAKGVLGVFNKYTALFQHVVILMIAFYPITCSVRRCRWPGLQPSRIRLGIFSHRSRRTLRCAAYLRGSSTTLTASRNAILS